MKVSLFCCKVKLRKKRKVKKDDNDDDTFDTKPSDNKEPASPGMVLTRATQFDEQNKRSNKIQILKYVLPL